MAAKMQWPPAGPMGSILHHFECITLCEPNEADQSDKQYDELINRIEHELKVLCAHPPLVCIISSFMS